MAESIEVVEKPGFMVIGYEASFISALSPDANNFEIIGRLWHRLLGEIDTIAGRLGAESYGVIYGRPAVERSHPDELQYIAGVRAEPDAPAPEGMIARPVEAGAFAVAIHRGPIEGLGETLQHLYREWLPSSDYQHSGVVDVELYDHRFCGDAEESVMEYWASVRRSKTDE